VGREEQMRKSWLIIINTHIVAAVATHGNGGNNKTGRRMGNRRLAVQKVVTP